MDPPTTTFGAIDISIFLASLITSAAIGIYYAIKSRINNSVDNYYYGGRKMSPVSVGISIAVTFISAITVLGYPSEAYLYGTVTLWYSFQLIIPNIISCLYYIPLVHRLKLKTIFKYLELRFNTGTRKLTAGIEVLSSLFYMGTILYLPALALNAVTPLSLNWSIFITSLICTSYTAFGGMKAVIWTDVLQTFVMLAGSLAALIQPAIAVGGFENVYRALERGKRLNFFEFDPNPRIRTTFWTIMIGTSITQATTSCCSQSISQRYASCKSIKDARKAALISIIPKFILSSITIFTGCAAYAYYEGCDPIKQGLISKPDQIIPYLVTDIFSNLPGLAGLFVSAAYSGTMSSVSSSINSASAIILEDFILPIKTDMGEKEKVRISFYISLIIGTMSAGLAYAASFAADTILSLILKIRGTFGGPTLGVFTLGLFFPWANTKGALVGLLTGISFTGWISIGGLFAEKDPASIRRLPLSIDHCEILNSTFSPFSTASNDHSTSPAFTTTTDLITKSYNQVYSISFMYLSCIGLVFTVVVGLIVSMLTNPNDPRKMKPKLFSPLISNIYCPKSVQIFFRCGVPDEDDEKLTEMELTTRLTTNQNSSIKKKIEFDHELIE